MTSKGSKPLTYLRGGVVPVCRACHGWVEGHVVFKPHPVCESCLEKDPGWQGVLDLADEAVMDGQ